MAEEMAVVDWEALSSSLLKEPLIWDVPSASLRIWRASADRSDSLW